MAVRLSVLVPGLLGPRRSGDGDAGGEALRYVCQGLPLDALERLLSRAALVASPWPGEGLEEIVGRALGYAVTTGARFPFAPIAHRSDSGSETKDWCVRADPVHLQADLQHLRLTEAGALDIEWSEAERLLGELNAHFSTEPWRMEAWHPHRWYLCGDDGEPGLAVVPPSLAASLPIASGALQGPRARYWRGILNEAQMLMHASPVNEDRARRGKAAINSVWLWGAGHLPPKPVAAWRSVRTQDDLVRMMAEHSQLEVRGIPRSLDDAAFDDGAHLIVLDELYRPHLMRDVEAWREGMSSLCSRVFAPLAELLVRGTIAEATIVSGSAQSFHLTRGRSRRWWVRTKRLPTFLPDPS